MAELAADALRRPTNATAITADPFRSRRRYGDHDRARPAATRPSLEQPPLPSDLHLAAPLVFAAVHDHHCGIAAVNWERHGRYKFSSLPLASTWLNSRDRRSAAASQDVAGDSVVHHGRWRRAPRAARSSPFLPFVRLGRPLLQRPGALPTMPINSTTSLHITRILPLNSDSPAARRRRWSYLPPTVFHFWLDVCDWGKLNRNIWHWNRVLGWGSASLLFYFVFVFLCADLRWWWWWVCVVMEESGFEIRWWMNGGVLMAEWVWFQLFACVFRLQDGVVLWCWGGPCFLGFYAGGWWRCGWTKKKHR